MPLSAKDYPAICQKLRSIGADKIPVYVVLIEDTYETYHGDGRFHDFYSVYLEKAVAVDLVEATGSGEQRTAYRQNAYLREMVISVSNGEVGIEEFHLEPFDTTRVATVVDALEKQLGKGGSS